MKALGQFQKNQADDATCAVGDSFSVIAAMGLMGRRDTDNLGPNGLAVPPSVSKANAVGGSVVPTNGRPNLEWSMAKTPGRVRRVTRGATRKTAVELGGSRS